jgi:tetratricopeptide (TPR) repeat protein
MSDQQVISVVEEDNDTPAPNLNLPDIFVAREEQMESFQRLLLRWAEIYEEQKASSKPSEVFKPNLTQNLECPVVLIYGRGGYGKSTLLGEWHNEIKEFRDGFFRVSKIIHCDQFSTTQINTLRHPTSPDAVLTPEIERVEPGWFFELIREELCRALGIEAKEFKEYEVAKKLVQAAQKDADKEIESLKADKNNKYEWIGDLSGILIKYTLKNVVPNGAMIPDPVLDAVQKTAGKTINISAVQLHELRKRLQAKLDKKFNHYLNPEMMLAAGLGQDLFLMARKKPLIIFIDTYELMSEGDDLLRLVMSVAGSRVGFVIAGRDDLYSDRSLRGTGTLGYQSITSRNLGFGVNFLEEATGRFSKANIKEYFDLLIQERPHLPSISDEEVEWIDNLTLGIPLAVRIVAATYLSNPKKELLQPEQPVNSSSNLSKERKTLEKEVLEVVVQRYLIHANISPDDKLRLYALALLRRPLQEEQARLREAIINPSGVKSVLPAGGEEFYRLHRRYSFVFEHDEPVLHSEVKEFLQRWLPEQKNVALKEIALKMAEGAFITLKERDQMLLSGDLYERINDEKWVEHYLDWLNLIFWADADKGVRNLLPIGIAAGIYQPQLTRELAYLGRNFISRMSATERKWWQLFNDAYLTIVLRGSDIKQKSSLEELISLVKNNYIVFPNVLQIEQVTQQLEAALVYRIGIALSREITTIERAFRLCIEALPHLNKKDTTLQTEVLEIIWNVVITHNQNHKYTESLAILDLAIDIISDNARLYYARGIAYYNLTQYDQAIADYTKAIELDSSDSKFFNNRGIVYSVIWHFPQALTDYTRAIELAPNEVSAYANRSGFYFSQGEFQQALNDLTVAIEIEPSNGYLFYFRGLIDQELVNYEQALTDYTKAIELGFTTMEVYNNRGFILFAQSKYHEAINDYSKAIQLAPNNALLFNSRAGTNYILEQYDQAIVDHNRAIELEPNNPSSYYNLAYTYLAKKDLQNAEQSYKNSCKMYGNYLEALWRLEWINMCQQTPSAETITRLEEIAALELEQYAAYLCRGVAFALRRQKGDLEKGLEELEKATLLDSTQPDAFFWKGLLLAYKGRYTESIKTIEESFKVLWRLPSILLLPVKHTERDMPQFWEYYGKPFLERYNLL